MKNFILMLGFMASFSVGSYAQLSGGVNDGNQYGFTTIMTKSKDLSAVEGSPYYHDDFVLGVLYLEDLKPLKAFMRYDVLNEVVEIKTEKNSNQIYRLPAGKKAEYEIGFEKFVLDKITSDGNELYGFFIEVYNGQSHRLLKKHVATVSEAIPATTGYGKDKPARIGIEEKYFLEKDNGQVQELDLKHRAIRKSFDSKRAQDYLKDNKIRSEEDLLNFVKFLDVQ